ncbi:hypothetical protein NDU88_007581 [Pleurodeles waltl]|uniref:Uncharacterized protein n=1 Tax=Pleurodeles waltl TaxID=8319 RepID=A0AAV7MGU9_PLEWA|nr:hypothetical protein NDU88_007581 [Pleurodeles waltl]
MLFGRQPRMLLDMLAEQWETTEEEIKDLLSHTRGLRVNLHTVWEEAHAALREAQMKQKRGPYDVIAQINPTTYKLAIPQGSGREQVYHINLLNKWQEPSGGQPIRYIAHDPTEEIPYPSLSTQTRHDTPRPWLNPTLTEPYRLQLTRLITNHQDVFSKFPGRTELVQHPIRLTVDKVSRQRPYRIPEAKKAIIEQEVQSILAAGIIEPSTSPWCSQVRHTGEILPLTSPIPQTKIQQRLVWILSVWHPFR